MPKLIVTTADGIDVTHELEEPLITIGRLPDNMLQIDDPSVSSHHAQLTLTGGDYLLKDLNSTNGTRVNGQAFDEGQLQDGDHVRFGKMDAVYSSEIPAETRPLPLETIAPSAPAVTSQLPTDFANASPFKTKNKKKDPFALGILAFAILAILAFCGAVAMIMSLQPPAL
jgi:pSer/pThr/pTyr-binding forkhead associated (FHA) protein